MTIVITGATGFLGLQLLPHLVGGGRRIVALTRRGRPPVEERLTRCLRAQGVPEHAVRAVADRVHGVPVDLNRADLGLAPWQFSQLAAEADEFWHLAGHVGLNAPAAAVTRTNVAGTAHLLNLAAAAGPGARVHHVSTAFVAGGRGSGTVHETQLNGDHGFENAYERSKFEAEQHIRRWAAERRAKVVVFRPSILVSDRPSAVGTPSNPLAELARAFGLLTALLPGMPPGMPPGTPPGASVDPSGRRTGDPTGGPSAATPLVRIDGREGAHLNLLPVDAAARLMHELAGRLDPVPGTPSTCHITHYQETSVQTVFEAVGALHGLRIRLTPGPITDATDLERFAARATRAFAPYANHRRTYLRTTLREHRLDGDGIASIDRAYLVRGMQRIPADLGADFGLAAAATTRSSAGSASPTGTFVAPASRLSLALARPGA
ncbi:SDR family oxidoreductase [Streptomyces polygonati]|uniref:SDR family oxidoreductase n=1 Tax=Streptomyces polygonati TaxID=1617087 RepID=A0ABV8HY51_9ACTN